MIYAQIADSAPVSRTLAERTFIWLLCSPFQLSPRTVTEAVSFGLLEMETVSITDLLDICCNLVNIDSETGIVRFAHLSVQEFLESLDEFTKARCHELVATTSILSCMQLLSYNEHELREATSITSTDEGFEHISFHAWPALQLETENALLDTFLFENHNPSASFQKWASMAYVQFYRYQVSREQCRVLLLLMTEAYRWPRARLWLESSLSKDDCNFLSDDRGDVPLKIAARYNLHVSLQILLDHGADPGVTGAGVGWTALHVAVDYESSECINILVDHVYNVDFPATEPQAGPLELRTRTRLQIAHFPETEPQAGTAGSVGYRTDAPLQVPYTLSAEPRAVSERLRPMTPLEIALRHRFAPGILLLLQKGARLENSRFPWFLHWACACSESEIVQLMLEEQPGLQERDKNGMTALHVTLAKSLTTPVSVAIVKMLLEKGADPNARVEERGSETCLHIAASRGWNEAVQELLNSGSQIDAQKRSGDTALHIAVASGQIDTVRFLLAQGAQVNLATSSGRTPLHTAVWVASLADSYLIRALLDGGADSMATAHTGDTPLDQAVRKPNESAILTLLQNGAEASKRTLSALNSKTSIKLKETSRTAVLKSYATKDISPTLDDGFHHQLRGQLEHADEVSAIAFSPDGRRLATGCTDGTLTVWNVESMSILSTVQCSESSIFAINWSHDNQLILTSSDDRFARAWNPQVRY